MEQIIWLWTHGLIKQALNIFLCSLKKATASIVVKSLKRCCSMAFYLGYNIIITSAVLE